ncbi:DUF5710 domain-containing protein [Stenotrophomonas sp. S39]|uniref:DUF5710 domain-containing protein n=1 Tax=Stenotrophomonas sp. S39 TaxID=2767451 RepID=UPI001909E84A|nr:DUF5710 domain-containing protein [Stenotrophomonas sp. S39]MBK0052937.1 hypothetical protein [Stenotrophomonas sp. S39]
MMAQYFHVPFSDKDTARELGARFDGDTKHWYADTVECIEQMRLHFDPITNPNPITTLMGEDRTFGGNHLHISMVPMSCWMRSVKACLDPHDWKRLSAGLRQRSNHTCELCGAKEDPKREEYLDVIARWEYSETGNVQTLKRLVSACQLCVKATNYGYSKLTGSETEVRHHFKATTGCDDDFLDQHICDAFGLWTQRSSNNQKWTMDLSLLSNNGIRLANKGGV